MKQSDIAAKIDRPEDGTAGSVSGARRGPTYAPKDVRGDAEMSLRLIVGPPNSGRAGEVLRRVRDGLDGEPVLLAPTPDDAAQLERDLCADGDPVLGVTVTTFGWLFEDLAGELAIEVGPRLAGAERLALVRAAVARASLAALTRSAARPGFAPAMIDLIDELEAGLVDPVTLGEHAAALDGAAVERELAAIYRAYVELRAAARRSDSGQLADAVLAGLAREPAALRGRHLFLYGFDDLTGAQLELVASWAGAAAVTVAVNYDDRAALAARAAMVSALREEVGADEETALAYEPGYTSSALLAHLDRWLFEAGAAPVEPDDGLAMIECAGERGEAEAIALEAARLIAAGADPGEIAVAVRGPAASGPLIAQALSECGVPAALEAPIPVAATGVGRSVIALCRAASPSGIAADLLAHLRSDPGFPAGPADWLERAIARGEVDGVDDAYSGWATPPVHLSRLRAAAGPAARLRALARSAREIAEGPHRDRAPLAEREAPAGDAPSAPMRPLELRAAAAIADLAAELAAVGELPGCAPPDLEEAIGAIEGATVPAWRGPADGRVRILSPYRLRAGRARFLFCASLQEDEFPSAGPIDPLLGEERRAALGIAALRRGDAAAEERYLFHTCVSRPTERLYLTWRSSDEDGGALARSPFVDDVLDLLAPGAEARLGRTVGPDRVVPGPAEAPTERALARALVADRADPRAELGRLGVGGDPAERVLAMVASVPDPTALPGPLTDRAVLDDLAERGETSANSLESWLGCPYRWFVDHELRPVRLVPESDPLWVGAIVHDALERLYREAPGEEGIPRPGDVGRWRRRFGELLSELAGGAGGRPERVAALARARAQVEAFLEAEAATETELRPRPDLLEWQFGFEGEGDPRPLRRGDLVLRGRVDRIDVAADGRGAVVRDYKTGSNVVGAGSFADRGTLQIQLYMTAVRDLLGLDVIAGLYQPLGATNPDRRRPRGLARGGDERLAGLELAWRSKDVCETDDLEEHLAGAIERAEEAAGEMRAGLIGRRPLGGRCPEYCTFQPICRLERALGVPTENGTEEES
jgi:RecB family exonuclease